MNDRRSVACRPQATRHPRGFTLIEALIAMVVLAAATTGVLLIFANATADSADPQVRAQARAVAEAYMDEILLQAYADPNGGETGGAEAGESRAGYDDVWDYDALGSQPPTGMFGNALAGLGSYTVTVTISGNYPSDPATARVRVQHTSGRVDYTLRGERHDY